MDIVEALEMLDKEDDDLWTADGQAKTDAVSELVGEKVTRKMIIEAAPHFTRDTIVEEESEDAVQEEGQEEVVDHTDDAMSFFDKDYNSHQEVYAAVNALPVGALTDMVGLFDNQMIELERQMRDLESLRGMMKVARAATINRAKTETPDMDNQQAIRAFLEAQQKNRMEKVEATKEILKAVDLSKVDPRAMIDRAMARKAGRGMSRPLHPVRG